MSSPAAPLLEARQIRKAFPGVVALDGVDFTLRSGEVHALVGENGAGKSTLIKLLTGAEACDGGQLLLEGRPFAPADTASAQRSGVGAVYQEVNLLPNLTVAENLTLGHQPTRLGLVRRREMNRRAKDELDAFGLEIDVTRPLASYSVAVRLRTTLNKRSTSPWSRLAVGSSSTRTFCDRLNARAMATSCLTATE